MVSEMKPRLGSQIWKAPVMFKALETVRFQIPRHGILKADEDHLASGGRVDDAGKNCDLRLLHQEPDDVFFLCGGGERIHHLSCGGNEAHPVDIHILGPEFHGKAAVLFSHVQLHSLKCFLRPGDGPVVMAVAGLVACRCDDGGPGIDIDIIQIKPQRGFSHMASLVGPQPQADHQRHGKTAGQMEQVSDAHHDIVFLIGICPLPDQIKIPEVRLGGLQLYHGNGSPWGGSGKILVRILSSGCHRRQKGAVAVFVRRRDQGQGIRGRPAPGRSPLWNTGSHKGPGSRLQDPGRRFPESGPRSPGSWNSRLPSGTGDSDSRCQCPRSR